MQNETYEEIKIGVDEPLRLEEIINSDEEKYSGDGVVNGTIETKKEEYKGHPYSFTLRLGNFASCIFRAVPLESNEEEEKEIQGIES
jgi:hypothetical protein